MMASLTVGFQIYKLQLLSDLLVIFCQTCIKLFGLESSILINLLSFYIAFPFKINIGTDRFEQTMQPTSDAAEYDL